MTNDISKVANDGREPARHVKHAAKPAAGFAEALAARKGTSAKPTATLPDKVDHTVSFEHRGCWYSEDATGKITQQTDADAQSRSTGDTVSDRCGVFADGKGGFVYRNVLGETAQVKSFDPAQAGYFKTAEGSWAFRNSWGNVATKAADGSALTPPPHAHIINSI